MTRSRTILIVGMHSSPHVARWIDMIADCGWDIHLFPVFRGVTNPNLRNVTLHWPEMPEPGGLPAGVWKRDENAPVRLDAPARGPAPAVVAPTPAAGAVERALAFGRLAARNPREAARRLRRHMAARKPLLSAMRPAAGAAAAVERSGKPDGLKISLTYVTREELHGYESRLGESDAAAELPFTPGVLASVIRRVQPDLIHSMEFQHCGYLTLRARELYGANFPTWLATNWGSDIFYYRRFDDHRAQIQRLLKAIDVYSCECHRDLALAQDLGYAGPVMPVLPNSGGFDLGHLARLRSAEPPSKRKVLMIKGYQHFAGRAMVSLQILESLAERLADFEIVLYSVSSEPRRKALDLKARGVLDIRVIDLASHDEILACFGRARLYMGISISDAISTSVLEAMAMGAFPIQTNTSCCDEWFNDGEGGFIVPPDDFELIRSRFMRALEDDALVDKAAEINWRTVEERLDANVLGPKIAAFYEEIFARHLRPRVPGGAA